MRALLPFMLVGALAGLTQGCATRHADVPMPARFEKSNQAALQAAQHWQVIAHHFAVQLAEDLKERLGERAIFVAQPLGEPPFMQSFRELFITALVAQGVAVTTEARDALAVDVRYSALRFRPERVTGKHYFGSANMLAPGLWTAGDETNGTPMPVSQALAGGSVPRSELIVTATVVDAGLIVSRRSGVYYADDEDAALYWEVPAATGAGTRISVVGEK